MLLVYIEIYGQRLRSYIFNSCSTYKERTASVRIYGQRLYSYILLISYPYSDLLAPYLGTAIFTILCFLYLLDNIQIND